MESNTNTKKCKYCQSEIDEKAIICPICKKKQNKKMTKKKFIILIVILCLIIFSIIAYLYISNQIKENNEELKRIEIMSTVSELKKKANMFTLDILINGANLESVGNDVLSYWYDTIWEDKFDDINVAVQTALSDNEELLDEIELYHNDIKDDYKVLMDYDENLDSEILEIKEALESIYESYYNLYNVVTDPTGNYNSFRDNFSDAASNLSNELDTNSYLLE